VASGVAAAVYAFHGWTGVCLLGGAFTAAGLALFAATDRVPRPQAA